MRWPDEGLASAVQQRWLIGVQPGRQVRLGDEEGASVLIPFSGVSQEMADLSSFSG
jgi:hypothetical protein